MATGVEITKAQGQAITKSVIACLSQWLKSKSNIKTGIVNIKIAIPMIIGVYNFENRWMNFWVSLLAAPASKVSLIILAKVVSVETLVVFISMYPLVFSVPANTASPSCFSLAIGSPVIADSSIILSPKVIFPSRGIIAPGLIWIIVPISIWSIGISWFDFFTKAVLGTLWIKLSNADFEFSNPISSKRSPNT